MDIVVVGGFERSGHDSMAAALVAEGVRRGHKVRSWNWREIRPAIGEHLMFTMHRYAGGAGNASFAEVMANEGLVTALTTDLVSILEDSFPHGVDAILSVHPWSTLALANWLDTTPGPLLVDCHSDFTPFPVFAHRRVDSFVGTGRPRPVSAEVSLRLQVLGLPVRSSFIPSLDSQRSRTLVVNAGSDAWAVRHVAAVVPFVSRLLQPRRIVLLAPTADAARAWEEAVEVDPRTEILTGVTDIGPLLCAALWLLTKAGGTPVAEGLVAGCLVLAMPTGIPWEDDGLSWLAMRGYVVPVGGTFPLQWSEALLRQPLESDRELRSLLADAGSSIWRHVEAGGPLSSAGELATVARDLLASDEQRAAVDALPATALQLRKVLGSWRAHGETSSVG